MKRPGREAEVGRGHKNQKDVWFCVGRWDFREREKLRVLREILFMLYSAQAFIMSPRTIQWI